MTVRRAARIAAVVGVFMASSFIATSSRADHVVSFPECTQGSGPSPTLTPPPVEGEQTPPPQPESTPPPQNCMPSEGERIWGTRTVRFEIDQNQSRVRKVTLKILSMEEDVPHAASGNPLATWEPAEDETEFTFDWNSIEATPYNGVYQIVVRADATRPLSSSPHPAERSRVNLRVDNAPKAPSAPRILAATVGSITIEWPAAAERDVTSYTVYRATTESKNVRPDYSSFKAIGFTTGPAFRDNTVGAGTHWYAVRVTRRSVVTPDEGISSSLSPMSSPATVESPTKKPDPKKNAGNGDGEEPEARPQQRFIPYRQLAPARPRTVARAVPDAPFAYKLPYDDEAGETDFGAVEEGAEGNGATDPRGPVLPVAVGMFLVSSALAVGRMPY